LAFGEPVCNPESFRLEARSQIVCAKCGESGPFHAHHVVDKQTLRRYGQTGRLQYDTRNALRLCSPGNANNCHLQSEGPNLKLKTGMLTDASIEYAFEILGAYAYDYLRREYDDSAEDIRLATRLEAA
jgi:hypothetical protein